MILGTPTDVAGYADIGPTGVDEQAAMVLRFQRGRLASLHAAINMQTPQQAVVVGKKGFIHLYEHWWKGGPMADARRKELASGRARRRQRLPIRGR